MAYISPDTMIDYLLSSGLTKTELCERAGINRRTLYLYLCRRSSGGAPLQRRTVDKLKKAFDVRKGELESDRAARKELGL
jgi:hypothetical protein